MARHSYWTTKEGQRIHISKMDASHLINTAKFLIRTCIVQHERAILMLAHTPDFHGDMAQECFERAVDEYIESEPYDFLPPIFHDMVKEIQKRKLDFDEMEYYRKQFGNAL